MAWNIAPANIIDIIAATVTLVAALVNLMRRQIPGIRTLAYVMLAIALWSVFSAMEGMTSNLEAKVLLLNLQYATSRLFSFLFLLFIIDYYQLCPWLTVFRRWQLALALGGLTLIAFTNPWHHLFWKNYTGCIIPRFSWQPCHIHSFESNLWCPTGSISKNSWYDLYTLEDIWNISRISHSPRFNYHFKMLNPI